MNERRKEDGRWSDLEVSIAKIETHMKRSVPALEQVWVNEKDIIRIKTKQNTMIAIGSMIGLTSATIAIKTILNYFTKHPPPPTILH